MTHQFNADAISFRVLVSPAEKQMRIDSTPQVLVRPLWAVGVPVDGDDHVLALGEEPHHLHRGHEVNQVVRFT